MIGHTNAGTSDLDRANGLAGSTPALEELPSPNDVSRGTLGTTHDGLAMDHGQH